VLEAPRSALGRDGYDLAESFDRPPSYNWTHSPITTSGVPGKTNCHRHANRRSHGLSYARARLFIDIVVSLMQSPPMTPSAAIEAAKKRIHLLVALRTAEQPMETPEGLAIHAVYLAKHDGAIDAWQGAIRLIRQITQSKR